MTAERIEVSRKIAAEPSTVFDVVRSPAGHVAIDASGMLQDFTGEPATKVDDTFVIHMDREALNDYPMGKYDVTIRILSYEQDREISWTIEGQLNIGHVYGYRLEPAPADGDFPGGTLATSFYDWSTISDDWRAANIFPIIPESALRATLGILARTVEPRRSAG